MCVCVCVCVNGVCMCVYVLRNTFTWECSKYVCEGGGEQSKHLRMEKGEGTAPSQRGSYVTAPVTCI